MERNLKAVVRSRADCMTSPVLAFGALEAIGRIRALLGGSFWQRREQPQLSPTTETSSAGNRKKEKRTRNTRNIITIALLLSMALAGSDLATQQSRSGKAVAAVTIGTETALSFFGSTSFQNVGGTTIAVPAGKVQLVTLESSGDSQLYNRGSKEKHWYKNPHNGS
jgi:hypothetical protein